MVGERQVDGGMGGKKVEGRVKGMICGTGVEGEAGWLLSCLLCDLVCAIYRYGLSLRI